MNPLFIPLKTEFFEAFKNGRKTVEWRIYGPRWNENSCKPERPVVLSHGYGKKDRISGIVECFAVQKIDDPAHIFNRVFAEKANGKLAACIKIRVVEGNKPNSGGFWQWFEEGNRDPLTLRLTDNGAEVDVANDDETEGSDQYYWEQTPTDKLTMPGRWLKCTS